MVANWFNGFLKELHIIYRKPLILATKLPDIAYLPHGLITSMYPWGYEGAMVVELYGGLMAALLLHMLCTTSTVMYIPKSQRHHYPITNLVNWLMGMMTSSAFEGIMYLEDLLYEHPRPFQAPPKRKHRTRSTGANQWRRRRPGRPPDSRPPNSSSSEEQQEKYQAWATSVASKHEKQQATFDSDSFLMLCDPGASRCMTNTAKHFIGEMKPVSDRRASGVGSAPITHEGTVRWSWNDNQGRNHTMDIPNTQLCPDLPFCLLSPQHLSQEMGDLDGTGMDARGRNFRFYWNGNKHERHIPLDPKTGNVGFIRSAPGYNKSNKFISLCCLCTDEEDISCLPSHIIPPDDDSTDEASAAPIATNEGVEYDQDTLRAPEQLQEPFAPDDINVTKVPTQVVPDDVPLNDEEELELERDEHELLRLHYKLGHLPFAQLQLMATEGDLPRRLAHCRIPKCSACLFSKATFKGWRTKSPVNKGGIATVTKPGDCVSIDQIESSTPGLIAQIKGWITKKRYTTATVFVDHFSDLSYVHMQASTKGPDTLAAKIAFEAYAKSHGVTVKHYHADNGRFSEELFTQHVEQQRQTISFCGVNAHHQNGKAEKRIRDLQDRARTMMVHAKHRWRDAISANLWPYALRLANEVHKASLRKKDGKSPLELFSSSPVAPDFKHLQPFGCPVYVLDAKIQGGNKGAKWSERARCGIYLGTSPRHARSVALVLSLETGMVSPQFHVTFDTLFETVRNNNNKSSVAGLMPAKSLWQFKLGFTTTDPSVSEGDGEPQLPQTSTTDVSNDQHQAATPVTPHPPTDSAPQDEGAVPPVDAGHQQQQQQETDTPETPDQPPTGTSPTQDQPPSRVSRSGRKINRPARLIDELANYSVCEGEVLSVAHEYDIQDAMADPFAFAASSDPDTMYLHQAKREPDWANFKQAMKEEVRAHEDNKHWELIPKHQVPEGEQILPSVWAMKRKRRISTRKVYKWKARLNVHGGKQTKGVNFWETYAPVVSWTSIRLFLILSVLKGWHTRQIDFVLAYPQADIECDMYMEIPQGFNFGGSRVTHCLRLKKNIYGTRQAGRTWNQHLHAGLMDRGYTQSDIDPCVYYKGKCIFLVFVDDGIYLGPDDDDITKLIQELGTKDQRGVAFRVTDEGKLDEYLGVKIEHLEDGKIKLSQPHLIDHILEDLGFRENSTGRDTPALSTVILDKDLDGEPFDHSWDYRRVVGKLNFLEKSTRADISYAVHQVARFGLEPKRSHAKAVKDIGRYLLRTKSEGLILDPTNHSFECFTDSDYCGLWNEQTAVYDPMTARSRTGYIIRYAGCPVVWFSKLQTETALSTTEAEVIALSTALRDVIYLMQLLTEAKGRGIEGIVTTPVVHCKAFEDNSGAYEIARLPKMRPRTKHLNVKYYHFRDAVADGRITIHMVTSENQLGDLYTKPLGKELFEKFRKAIMGW